MASHKYTPSKLTQPAYKNLYFLSLLGGTEEMYNTYKGGENLFGQAEISRNFTKYLYNVPTRKTNYMLYFSSFHPKNTTRDANIFQE